MLCHVKVGRSTYTGTLWLFDVGLTSDALEKLTAAGWFENLACFDVGGNPDIGEGKVKIAELLDEQKMPVLATLCVRIGEGANEDFTYSVEDKKMNLSGKKLSDDDARVIASWLRHRNAKSDHPLKSIDLSNNQGLASRSLWSVLCSTITQALGLATLRLVNVGMDVDKARVLHDNVIQKSKLSQDATALTQREKKLLEHCQGFKVDLYGSADEKEEARRDGRTTPSLTSRPSKIKESRGVIIGDAPIFNEPATVLYIPSPKSVKPLAKSRNLWKKSGKGVGSALERRLGRTMIAPDDTGDT